MQVMPYAKFGTTSPEKRERLMKIIKKKHFNCFR